MKIGEILHNLCDFRDSTAYFAAKMHYYPSIHSSIENTMTSQIQNTITFKMRLGKKIEYAFISLWCLFIFAFSVWLAIIGINRENWNIYFNVFFMILFCLIPLFSTAISITAIIRAKLIFSKEGVGFQGALSFTKVPWEQITGFYSDGYNTFLRIERPNESRKAPKGIPISWFSRLRSDKKTHMPDAVISNLITFAPHLFMEKPPE